jgi:metallophosphoesterase (TIGR00282 family)
MRALLVGDVVGGVGMRALLARLPELREEHRPDVVVVNCENAAGGAGTSPRQATELLEAGVDVLTGGNHSLQKPEILPMLEAEPRMLRPANIAVKAPGRGVTTVETPAGPVSVVNIMGSVFMTASHSPFAIIDDLVAEARRGAEVVLVDVHAEATSEKIALAHHLDGRVSAVVGTHTHVQTADDRVLPQGTAYITDVGMTGPHDSVIGVDRSAILQRFLTALPQRFDTATENPRLNAVIVDADEASGRAASIERVSLSAQQIEALVAQPSAAH